MEDKLYDAIARVIMQNTTDEWGNTRPSVLVTAIGKWFEDKANQEKLRDLVASKLDIDYLVSQTVESLKKDFQNGSWFVNVDKNRERLNDMVLSRLADKLAEEKLQELKEVQNKEGIQK